MDIIKDTDLQKYLHSKSLNTFIGSSSFEDRCFAVCSFIPELIFEQCSIFRIADLNQRITLNSELYSTKLQTRNEPRTIDLSINQPINSLLGIRQEMDFLFSGSPKRVLVDITTFTHECLLILLRLINDKKRPKDTILFIYNGAESYSHSEQNEEDKWLTKGVKKTRSIIGYIGDDDNTKPDHLLVLFGFEKDRTLSLIKEKDCDYNTLAFGSKDASISPEHQLINEKRHQEILDKFPVNSIDCFNISLDNPINTKNEILEFVQKNADHGIVLAAMNNKLSTLGAGLAAIQNENIQLTYLQPNRYNFNSYSKPGNLYYVWEFKSDWHR